MNLEQINSDIQEIESYMYDVTTGEETQFERVAKIALNSLREQKQALSLLDVVSSVLCECESPSKKRNGCCRICGGEVI